MLGTRILSLSLRSAAVVAFSLGPSLPAAPEGFEGNLVLLPHGCEQQGLCTLGEQFSFVDASGFGWTARAGLSTDGASIPNWAQPIVGLPFTGKYIKAAVIHDHYCDRHVRSWRRTHRVFYEALRSSGVSSGTAGIMYFAVLAGGPKWIRLVKGKPARPASPASNSSTLQ